MAFALQNQGLYLFGGSSNRERQRMPAYAAQWAAIQWCKERGCSYYDLWGVPDAPEDELEACFQERDDGLWGVYRHKRGYGGEVRRTVGSVDRIYNNRLYRLYQWRRRRAEAAVVEVEAAS
jgi:lipid II:glycine glycyltransferase (peptidoglycan interpeptide bridge formation enzyme)